MRRTLFFGILVALLMANGSSGQLSAQGPVTTLSELTGPAVLDDWGKRFTSLGASVLENAFARKSAPPSHRWRCSTP